MKDFESVSSKPYIGDELPPFDDPKYLALLEDSDISTEQAVEFLRALNSILVTCVDIGFGVDAVQLAIPGLAEFCEQPESDAEISGREESLQATNGRSIEHFNDAAEAGAPQKGKR